VVEAGVASEVFKEGGSLRCGGGIGRGRDWNGGEGEDRADSR
jgi:hypothetical protein